MKTNDIVLNPSRNAAEHLESDFASPPPTFSPSAKSIQMKAEEDEEHLQLKKAPFQMKNREEEEEIQMKTGGKVDTNQGGGSSNASTLPDHLRSQMEASFGANFSGVRIHNNSENAKNLGAKAYTQGEDIHFASGDYNPTTQEGKELVAHELTHVIQQKAGKVEPTTEVNGAKINDSSSLEKEADEMGSKAAKGEYTGKLATASESSTDNHTKQLQKKDPLTQLIGILGDAKTIHDAVEGWGTDEAAIFNTLLPLNKSQIKQLKVVYKTMYGVGLMQDLRGDLNNSELQTALIYMYYYPFENDIIGSFQCERAADKLLEMSGEELETFTNTLDGLNNSQRSYIWKALASSNSISSIKVFSQIIKGKDDDWLQNNCQLTNHTDGTGIKQQWSHSCNATTVQAFRGQMDPIYAYTFNLINSDISAANNNNGWSANPLMAADQKAMLESNYDGSLGTMGGGTAVARNAGGGVGRWADDLLNSNSDDTGVSYSTLRRGDGVSYDTLMTEIKKGASRGIPVPIVVGSGISSYAHYVMVTAIDKSQTPAVFTIHDPGAGVTVQFTEDDFKNNTLSLSGWTTLSAVEAVTEE